MTALEAAAAECSKRGAALSNRCYKTRARRSRYGIRRLLDGRVQLRSRKGEWFTVRLDMEVPGALLLRDSKGNVYAIETEGLPQVRFCAGACSCRTVAIVAC